MAGQSTHGHAVLVVRALPSACSPSRLHHALLRACTQAQAPLLTPQVLICSVGSEIFHLSRDPSSPLGLRYVPDDSWEKHLSGGGWDRQKVVAAASAFPLLKMQARAPFALSHLLARSPFLLAARRRPLASSPPCPAPDLLACLPPPEADLLDSPLRAAACQAASEQRPHKVSFLLEDSPAGFAAREPLAAGILAKLEALLKLEGVPAKIIFSGETHKGEACPSPEPRTAPPHPGALQL